MAPMIQPLPGLQPGQWMAPPRARAMFPLDRPDAELTYLGRNAVWRAVRRLGLAGAELIVPAYHHGVEVEALLDAGAKLRFARVDEHARLDLDHVASLVGPQTRAVYVIHYAGFPQPMEPLLALARDKGLRVIEDCALSLFSSDGQRPLGSAGDAAIFCFYKTLPVSHGGGLVVEPKLAGRLPPLRTPPLLSTLARLVGASLVELEHSLGAPGRWLRRCAKSATRALRERADEVDVPVGTQRFDPAVVDLGMSPLNVRLLKAADADEVVHRRRENWAYLHEHLGERGRSVWNVLSDGVCPLFYGLRVWDKDRALETLRQGGVNAVDFWRFGHGGVERGAFPEVEALRREVVELPCHQDLRPEQLARVVQVARAAMAS